MKKFLIAILILTSFVPVHHSKAAIAFDAFTSGGLAIPATTLTWAHNILNGTNPMLCVGDFGTTAIHGPGDILSITYNSVNLTKVFDVQLGAQITERWIDLWCATGVGSGNHNIVLTQTSNDLIMPLSCSYSGVKQTTPEVTQNTPSTGTTNVNTLTIATTNAWHIEYAAANPTISTSTNATSRGSNLTAAQSYCIDANGALPTGSHSITINLGTSGNSSTLGIDVAPAPSLVDAIFFAGD